MPAFVSAQGFPPVTEFKPYRPLLDISDLKLKDAVGREHTMAEYKGSWVVLNLWATWCPPCVQELPTFEELDFKVSDTEFKVLAVSVDKYKSGPQLKVFLEGLGVYELPFAYDNKNAILRQVKYRGLPTTYVIDPQSNIHAIHEGVAHWSDPKTIEAIKAVITDE